MIMDGVFEIPAGTRDLYPDVIMADGTPRILPASYYASTTQAERSLLCMRHGMYVLPTVELIRALREEIGERSAIEIGSGNGAVARALCIPATDNRMQEWPQIAAAYRGMGQQPVSYGANVECLDGLAAVAKYRPQVIVGCWLTHRYRPQKHEAGGNMHAPDETRLLGDCETLLLVLNESTHKAHPLLKFPHLHVRAPWLYSRAGSGRDFLGIWKGLQVK